MLGDHGEATKVSDVQYILLIEWSQVLTPLQFWSYECVLFAEREWFKHPEKSGKLLCTTMQHCGTLVLIRCQGTNVAVLFPECQNAQYYWPFSAFHMHVSRTIDGLPWLRFLAFYDVNIHPINMYIHYRDKLALRSRLVFANEDL